MKYYSSGCLNIQKIGFLVPRPLIWSEKVSISLEYKGPILVKHSHKTGAARSSIKPPSNRVIIRIFLGFEIYVMIFSSVKSQVTWIIIKIPEYHVWLKPGIVIWTSSSTGAEFNIANKANIRSRFFIFIYFIMHR